MIRPIPIPATMLERQSGARVINAIMNDASVRPHIGGTGPIDLTALIANPDNVVLCGEYGGAVFHRLLPGLFELHTAVLPDGRGAWAVRASVEAFRYMFCRTDCVEVVTKVPFENQAAAAASRQIGLKQDWLSPCGWVSGGQNVAVPVYSLKFTDWPNTCQQTLRPLGEWFHAEIQEQLAKLRRPPIEHLNDEFHDVVVGAVVAMIEGGQVMKAVTFYNRRAAVAKTPLIRAISAGPVVIDLHECRIRVVGDNFEVM